MKSIYINSPLAAHSGLAGRPHPVVAQGVVRFASGCHSYYVIKHDGQRINIAGEYVALLIEN